LPLGCTVGAACVMTFAFAAEMPTSEADLQALIDRAQARADAASGSVEKWVQTLDRRGDGYAAEAQALADHNTVQLARGIAMNDDPAVRDAGAALGAGPPKDGAAYVAVSLSMPQPALRALARDAEKAHVQMVIRGLEGGSFKTTLVKIRAIFDEKSAAGLSIDPNVFRAFNVQSVPTFIVATAPAQACKGLGCVVPTPAHDQVAGNISLRAALTALAEEGDQASPVASSALARLGT